MKFPVGAKLVVLCTCTYMYMYVYTYMYMYMYNNSYYTCTCPATTVWPAALPYLLKVLTFPSAQYVHVYQSGGEGGVLIVQHSVQYRESGC